MTSTELSDLRAKLPPDALEKWRQWVFDHLTVPGDTTKALAHAIAGDESVSGKAESIRTPLTNFLNGYTHEVHRWLAGDSTANANALCRLMVPSRTPTELWQYFLSLMPREHIEGLTLAALDHLEPEVLNENSRTSGFLQPLSRWFKERELNVDLPGQPEEARLPWGRYREYLSALLDALEALEDRPGIRLVASSGERHVVGDDTLFLHVGRRKLEQFRSEKPDMLVHADSPADEADVVQLDVAFVPMRRATFVDWVTALEALRLLDQDQAGRSRQFFGQASVEMLNRLAPKHLVYLVEDAANDPLDYEPVVFQQRRIRWIRRDLSEAVSPDAAAWLRDTRGFFSRWLGTAGTLHGDVSREELNEILELPYLAISKVKRDDLERAIGDCLSTSSDSLPDLKRQLALLLPDRLKLALEDSGLIVTGASNELSPSMRTLGELELALELRPSDMRGISVRANPELIAEAVRLAPATQLDAWCEAALGADGFDQPFAMQTVVRGMAARSRLGSEVDGPTLTRLWASFVWASAHGLNYYIGARDMWSEHVAREVSERLKNVLPILDGPPGPSVHLESLADRDIRRLVEDWCDRSCSDDVDISDALASLAPFQLPLEHHGRRYQLPRLLRQSAAVELHLAEHGDLAARRAILNNQPSLPVEERPKLETRLDWWLELVESEANVVAGLDHDLRKAFSLAVTPANEKLRSLVGRALEHPRLSRHFPNEAKTALEMVDMGFAAAITRVMVESRRPVAGDEGFVSFSEALVMVAELRHAQDFLSALVSMPLDELSEEARSELFEASLKDRDGRPPQLLFPNLEMLAEIRHQALLAVARSGDLRPLRESLNQPWEVQSPYIGHHSRLARALLTAVEAYGEPSERPTLDDEIWHEVLESLGSHTLDELRKEFTRFARPSVPFDAPYRREIVELLAMVDAPSEHRWRLLAPYTRHLWHLRHYDAMSRFYRLIDELIVDDVVADRWRAPQSLAEKRRTWAERNDEVTAKRWCEEWSFNAGRQLVDDLNGFGEWVWPHLSHKQRRDVLLGLPEGPLDEPWWSRGQDLPLEDRLHFARRHGPLSERRRIARHFLEAGSATPEERLWNWLRLRGEERPTLDELANDVEAFWSKLDKRQLAVNQASLAAALLVAEQQGDRVVTWLPSVIERWVKQRMANNGLQNGGPLEGVPLPISHLISRLRPSLAELDARRIDDLCHNIKRLPDRLYKFASTELPNEDHQLRRRLDEVASELVSRIRPASQPSPWSPVANCDEAKKRLRALDSQTPLLTAQIEFLVEGVSATERPKLLEALQERRDLLEQEGVVESVLLQIDRSTLPRSGRLKLAETVLDVAENGLNNSTERRRDLIAGLLECEGEFRRTELRTLVRKRVRDFSDGLTGGDAVSERG